MQLKTAVPPNVCGGSASPAQQASSASWQPGLDALRKFNHTTRRDGTVRRRIDPRNPDTRANHPGPKGVSIAASLDTRTVLTDTAGVDFMLAEASYTESGDGPYRHDLPAGEGEWQQPQKDTSPEFDHWRLWFTCPCGCARVHVLPVKPGPNSVGKWWGWNGNQEAPTLTPSVLIHNQDGHGEHWHGHLVDGVWKKC